MEKVSKGTNKANSKDKIFWFEKNFLLYQSDETLLFINLNKKGFTLCEA